MGIEIERKFLVIDDSWRGQVVASERMSQGYLSRPPPKTPLRSIFDPSRGKKHLGRPGVFPESNRGMTSVRVRIGGGRAHLNIKSGGLAVSRREYEYEIPLADAEEMLEDLAAGGLVEKTRYHVKCGGHLWDLDVFEGANAGLIVAEIELSSEDEPFEMPAWAGREVSGDPRYYNVNLIQHPYRDWSGDA